MPKLTVKKIRSEFEENYRQMEGSSSKNRYKINIIDSNRVRAVSNPIQHSFTNYWGGDWFYYDGNFKLTVSRMQALPLVTDGMMNLYSQYHSTVNKIRVYKAKWIVQSHGTLVRVEQGYIGYKSHRNRRVYFHATTPDKASDGVLRKIRRPSIGKIRGNPENSTFFRCIPEDLKICFKDSIRAGNCESGTRNFANRHGLNTRRSYGARQLFLIAPRDTNLRGVILFKMRQMERAKAKKADKTAKRNKPNIIQRALAWAH